MARPSDGFPRMVADDSELEGLCRFFGCEEVEAEDVLAPHIEATFQRMREVDGASLGFYTTVRTLALADTSIGPVSAE